MLSKRNLLIWGLAIVLPIVLPMVIYDFRDALFLLVLIHSPIPVFAASFLALSFIIKSNKFKIIISASTASILPLLFFGTWLLYPNGNGFN